MSCWLEVYICMQGMTTHNSEVVDQDRQMRFHKARLDDYVLQREPQKAWEHFNSLRAMNIKDHQLYEDLMESFLEQKDTKSVLRVKELLENDNIPYNTNMYTSVCR